MNIIGLERIGVTTAQSIGKEKMAATGDTPRLSPVRVRQIAQKQGYQEIPLAAREQKHLLSFKHNSKPGCGGPDSEQGQVRIDVYFTTGTVTTSLNHPTRGKGQLQRIGGDYALLEEIFVNPRHHSGSGYRTREVTFWLDLK